MTRINLGISPKNLCDQHLIAEHREIKRIPNVMLSGKFSWTGIPSSFTLGTGHVKFFYNKLDLLTLRYSKIYTECLRRNFNITYYMDTFNLAFEKYGYRSVNYIVTQFDIEKITKRLEEKLLKMKSIRYYSKNISSIEACEILKH